MRETAVLCEVVCGAETAEASNRTDFALRCDGELCAHDGESRIGVFDASESDKRTRHARRGRLHSRYRRSSAGLPVTVLVTGVWTGRDATSICRYLRATCEVRVKNESD